MKPTTPALLLSLAGSLAQAQEVFNTSDPFTLSVSTDDDDTIDGQFLDACHSGAALAVLCLYGSDGTPSASNTYRLNTTSDDTSEFEEGLLVWELEGSGFNVSEALVFTPYLTSNVVTPQFQPGAPEDGGYLDYVGFDDDDVLFIYSGYVDEKNFTAGTYPTSVTPYPLYQVRLNPLAPPPPKKNTFCVHGLYREKRDMLMMPFFLSVVRMLDVRQRVLLPDARLGHGA